MSPTSSSRIVPPSASSKWPLLVWVAPGEGTLLVTEQHALHQRLGNRRAVDRNERALAAARQLVQGGRDHFLAGTRLAAHQDGVVGGRVELDALDQLGAGRAAGLQRQVLRARVGDAAHQAGHQSAVAQRTREHAGDECHALQVGSSEHGTFTHAVRVQDSQGLAERLHGNRDTRADALAPHAAEARGHGVGAGDRHVHHTATLARLLDQRPADAEGGAVSGVAQVEAAGRVVAIPGSVVELQVDAIGSGRVERRLQRGADHALGLGHSLEGVRDLHEGPVPAADGRPGVAAGLGAGVQLLAEPGAGRHLHRADLDQGGPDVEHIPARARSRSGAPRCR